FFSRRRWHTRSKRDWSSDVCSSDLWYSPFMPEFMSSLAISGVDGTVRRRLHDDEVRGRAHLKTGTLRDARALAGYVLAANGKRYILVSIANHAQAAAVRPFNDALVKWVAEH